MALLVLDADRVVRTETIVDELWGATPPRTARTTVQTYVYQLRRCIADNGLAADPESMLATRGLGYVLRVDPSQVDVTRFHELLERGRAQFTGGDPAAAAATLERALRLPTGTPLENVRCSGVLSGRVLALQEQLRDARHLRVEAAIACGDHRGLVGDLRAWAAEEPFDEELHGQLIRVLARSGRRSEAMTTYRDLRQRLVHQLGVEPSGALRSLHLGLLSDAA